MKIKDIWAFIITPHPWTAQELQVLTAMYNSLIDRLPLPPQNKQAIKSTKICATCRETAHQSAAQHIERMKGWIRQIQKT
jgi:hypothetical protein